MRKLLGEDGDTVLFASYAMAYERHGHVAVHRRRSRPTRASRSRSTAHDDDVGSTNTTLNQDGLGAAGALPADRRVSAAGPFATTPYVSVRAADHRHGRTSSTRTSRRRTRRRGPAASAARSRRDIGLEVRYVGTRHLQGWGAFDLNEIEHQRERVPEGVPPGAGEPAGEHRGRPRQLVRVHSAPTRARAPLPIYLAYFNGCRTRAGDTRRMYRAASWTDTNFTEPAGDLSTRTRSRRPAPTPTPGLDGDAHAPRQRARRGPAARTSSGRTPIVCAAPGLRGNTGYQSYDSFQMRRRPSGCRTASWCRAATSSAMPTTRRATRCGRAASRRSRPARSGGVDPRVQGQLGLRAAVRQRPPVPQQLNRHRRSPRRRMGVRTASSASRAAACSTSATSASSGMSEKDLQNAIKLQEFAATGIERDRAGEHLPDAEGHHREHRPRLQHAARRRRPATAAWALRPAATSRRANGPDCIETIAGGYGDCGIRTLVVTGPMLSALGHQRGQAHAARRAHDARVPRRHASTRSTIRTSRR